MESGKFKFTYIPKKTCKALEERSIEEFLMKWSLKGHLRVKYFNFNEPFFIYDAQSFVDSFFTSRTILENIEVVDYSSNTWNPLGIPAEKVTYERIPCTVTSMEFFKKIEDEKNEITADGGRIIPCMEEPVEGFDGFYTSNNLQRLVLDKQEKEIYSESEREQFIFRMFKHLVLGGKWCQYDDILKPYLDVTKNLYKDLISVERYEKEKNLFVRSVVLKCIAYGSCGAICPSRAEHIQNFIYLIIDPFKRQVATFQNQYSDIFVC